MEESAPLEYKPKEAIGVPFFAATYDDDIDEE